MVVVAAAGARATCAAPAGRASRPATASRPPRPSRCVSEVAGQHEWWRVGEASSLKPDRMSVRPQPESLDGRSSVILHPHYVATRLAQVALACAPRALFGTGGSRAITALAVPERKRDANFALEVRSSQPKLTFTGASLTTSWLRSWRSVRVSRMSRPAVGQFVKRVMCDQPALCGDLRPSASSSTASAAVRAPSWRVAQAPSSAARRL